MRTFIAFTLAAGMALPSQATQAARLDLSAELALLHSDNINLSGLDPVDANVLVPSLAFRFSEAGSRVQASINGYSEYRRYLDHEFGNETRSNLDGVLDWMLLPERLKWTFADSLGLNPIDLRRPDAPDNLQRTNVFSTGPTLQFRLGTAFTGQAELRYTDSQAEITDAFDSTRQGAALRGIRELDSRRSLSLNLESERTRFDQDALDADYTRHAAFVGYSQKLANVDFDLAAGHTYLDYRNGTHANEPLLRANLDWRAGSHSVLGVGVYWGFSDAANRLANGSTALIGDLGTAVVGNAAISPEIYQDRRIEGRYGYTSARLNLSATFAVERLRYERAGLEADRNETSARLDLGYNLRPTLTLGAQAGHARRQFQDAGADSDDTLFGVYLRQQLNRHWGWRADFSRNERDSDFEAFAYAENQAWLRLTWTR